MESLGDQKNEVYGGQCQFKLWSALFNVDVVQLNSYFLQSFYNEVIFLTWVIQLRLTVYIFIISSIIYILICIGRERLIWKSVVTLTSLLLLLQHEVS